MPSLRYLSAADVTGLLPPTAEVIDMVEAALKASAGSPVEETPQIELSREQDGFLKSQPGLVALCEDGADAPIAVREVGTSPPLRRIAGAACTAVSARHLADAESEVMTIVGCGPQGRANIEALLSVFPETERMLCYDPDFPRQESFADEVMTTFNLASIIPPEPYEAVVGANVLVTATSTGNGKPEPVIETSWLQKGTLAVAMDGDLCFKTETFNAADRLIVDDRELFDKVRAEGRFAGVRDPDAELAAVVGGSQPGRGDDNPTIIVVSFGLPALERALATEVLRRAAEAGQGTVLPT